MTRAWLRWLPAAAVPAVVAVGALVGPFRAAAAADLPVKTPEQVLAMIAGTSVRALSGTVEQSSDLGLPQLPATGASASSSANKDLSTALELLGGSHTARVYVDSPTKSRIQVLDRLAERDVVRQGDDLWFYNSKENSATHLTLPARAGQETKKAPRGILTPDQLAARMVAAIDPSTEVTVAKDTVVAGRSAYDLRITPRSSVTLVGSVAIAVDAETGLPLSVAVQARGQTAPAFKVAFTSLSLGSPSADLFRFTPPAGAKVTEKTAPDKAWEHKAGTDKQAAARPDAAARKHTVSGSGWESVVGLRAGALPAQVTSSPLFTQATTAVAGGRLLSTALLNVFVTDDGRVFAGMVPFERLQAAAAGR